MTVVQNEKGSSLIEVLVSIFLIGTIVYLFSSSMFAARLDAHNRNKAQAYSFANMQAEALRDYPFDKLDDRTDGSFIGFAYNWGSHEVVEDSSAHGGVRSANILPAESQLDGGISSLAVFPEGNIEDIVESVYFKISDDPPSGWEAGEVIRYQDINNYYFFKIDSAGLELVKSVDGARTVLYSEGHSFSPGTWIGLKIDASGSVFDMYLNDVFIDTASDGDISSGYAGIMGTNGALFAIDDIYISSPSADYDLDLESDPIGEEPPQFFRLAPDLPGIKPLLSIENYLGDSTIKKADIKLEWEERGQTKDILVETIKSQL